MSAIDSPASPPASRSRLPSPGCLFAVTLLITLSLVCGWFAWRAHQQASLIELFEKSGGRVETQPARPVWLHNVVESALGTRYAAGFTEMTSLNLEATSISDSDLRLVAGLT